jgi:hypothetical protein
MTMQDDADDNRIDDVVRRTAARPVDEALLTRTVLSRIRHEARPATSPWAHLFAFPEFAGIGRLAPAGFALVLLGTPFAIAGFPADTTERAIYALAMGDPALITSTETPLLMTGFFE